MANQWEKFKRAILLGLDINLALLVTSIVLIPYSILASFLFGMLTVTGMTGASFVSLVTIIALGIMTLIIQLAALGWIYKWLNRKGWMPSNWIDW